MIVKAEIVARLGCGDEEMIVKAEIVARCAGQFVIL